MFDLKILAASGRAEGHVVIAVCVDVVDPLKAAGECVGNFSEGLVSGLLRCRRRQRGSGKLLLPAPLEKADILLRRDRAGEIVALHQIAAHFPEHGKLLRRLHPLGDDRDGEIVRDVDDQLQHAGVLPLTEGVADKLSIQLQRVNGQGRDHIQGRITRAEIIHLDPKALVPERIYRFYDLVGVLRIGRFRDFQQEIALRKAVVADKGAERFDQMRIVHVDAGNVDRDRNGKAQSLAPFADLSGRRAPDIVVQLADQAVVLKQGNKHAGADQPQFRVLPAHQRFRAGQDGDLGPDVEFRLIENTELLFLDGTVEILDQLLGIQLALVQRRVILSDGAGEAVAHGIRGDLRPVKATFDVKAFVHRGIHAHTQTNAAGDAAVLRQADRGFVQDRFIVLAVGAVDHEDVRLTAADDAARVPHRFPQAFTDAAQHLVAIGVAEAFVDHVEVVDVHNDRVHLHVPMMLVELLGIAVKVFAVIQPRQRIPLGGLDDVAVLAQFDGAPGAGQDHPWLRIGFGNKVDCTEFEASDLGVLIGRQDNDGDLLQLRIILDLPEHLGAGHHRHQQIQQDQRELILVRADLLQRLASVFGKDQLVIRAENGAEQLAVDPLIVDDQDQTPAVGRMKFFMTFQHAAFSSCFRRSGFSRLNQPFSGLSPLSNQASSVLFSASLTRSTALSISLIISQTERNWTVLSSSIQVIRPCQLLFCRC